MANINCPDFRYGSSFQVLQQEKQKLKKKNLETAKNSGLSTRWGAEG